MEKEDNKLNNVQSLELHTLNSAKNSLKNVQSQELGVTSVNTTTKTDEKLLPESNNNSIKTDLTEKCLKNLQSNNNNQLFVNTEDTINHIVTANQGICYTRLFIKFINYYIFRTY